MINFDKFIEKAREVHGDKYNYSKVEYKKVTDKVCIICPEHGEFYQEARKHYSGQGCPKCASQEMKIKRSYTTDYFIKKAKEVHGNKYDYSKVEYIDSQTKVCIICPEHGEFWIRPDAHIFNRGCPKCGNLRKGIIKKLTQEEFIQKAKEVHGHKYDYSKVKYVNNYTKVCIICPEHGEFWQSPYSHINGSSCPKCASICRADKLAKTTEKFINDAKLVHGNRYNYSKVNYVNSHTPVKIICPEHGEFEQNPTYHLDGCGCQKCAMIVSHYEDELFNFISSLITDEIIRDDRSVLSTINQSLDIYIPSKKIAFEFDGLYWHCEVKKNNHYHLTKTRECLKKDVQLIHIFEDEWIYKKEIVKSRIKNLLGVSDIKIYARKCTIKEINNKQCKEFCEKNHLQGFVNGKYALGLYYNEELVSIMQFGLLRKNLGSKNECGKYELLRFCSKLNYNVIGGAGKLFNHFINNYSPDEVISYADKRWSKGNLYEKLGFVLSHSSKPNYFYVFGDTRKNRFNFRKDLLISKYGCPKEMSEHEFCLKQHWYRIYDCGALVYMWKRE